MQHSRANLAPDLRVHTTAYGEGVAHALKKTGQAVVTHADWSIPGAAERSAVEEFEDMLSETDLWHDADLLSVPPPISTSDHLFRKPCQQSMLLL